MDHVFKALADPTRRLLLDALRAQDGQTLGELCAHLDMTRQAVTQHLSRLQDANLISAIRRGREKRVRRVRKNARESCSSWNPWAMLYD